MPGGVGRGGSASIWFHTESRARSLLNKCASARRHSADPLRVSRLASPCALPLKPVGTPPSLPATAVIFRLVLSAAKWLSRARPGLVC